MDRTLWARFGEATLKAPHAIQWLSDNGPQYTATATVLYAHEFGLVPITTRRTAPRATAWPKPLWGRSNVTISGPRSCTMRRRCSRSSAAGSKTTTRGRRTQRSGCAARGSIVR
jgi:hypothetical protein